MNQNTLKLVIHKILTWGYIWEPEYKLNSNLEKLTNDPASYARDYCQINGRLDTQMLLPRCTILL